MIHVIFAQVSAVDPSATLSEADSVVSWVEAFVAFAALFFLMVGIINWIHSGCADADTSGQWGSGDEKGGWQRGSGNF